MSGAPQMTKNGYVWKEVASALQKEIRRGHEETALFWAMELYETTLNYCWKRLAIIASEDVGMADPFAAVLVQALWASHDRIRAVQDKFIPVEGDLLAHAVLYLCRAPKSRLVDEYKNAMLNDIAEGWRPEIPEYAKDVHTGARGVTQADWWRNETAAIAPRDENEDTRYRERAMREVKPVKVAAKGQRRLFERDDGGGQSGTAVE